MFRRFRVKFTAAAVGAIVMVLAVILGAVNAVNYHNVIRDAGYVLDLLAEHQGTFPDDRTRENREKRPGISPETPYETRFFTVTVDKDGNILATDTERIAAVDEAEAESYAMEALEAGVEEGFLSDYRYRCRSLDGDATLLIFLDCSRSLSTFRNFLLTSILVSVMGGGGCVAAHPSGLRAYSPSLCGKLRKAEALYHGCGTWHRAVYRQGSGGGPQGKDMGFQ